MRRTNRLPAAVVGLALALALTACSSTAPPSKEAAKAPARSQAKVNPTLAPGEVEHAYTTLFDMADKSVAPKLAVIQDGETLRQAITQAVSSSLASTAAGAKVINVKILPAAGCQQSAMPSPCAEVTYDILGTNGQPILPSASTGYAVFANGTWVVAKDTICSLLQLFESTQGKANVTPRGC